MNTFFDNISCAILNIFQNRLKKMTKLCDQDLCAIFGSICFTIGTFDTQLILSFANLIDCKKIRLGYVVPITKRTSTLCSLKILNRSYSGPHIGNLYNFSSWIQTDRCVSFKISRNVDRKKYLFR